MAAVLHLGGDVASLDTRLKTRQSLFEKLSRLPPQVGHNVRDALRFTAVFSDDGYVEGVVELAALIEQQLGVDLASGRVAWGARSRTYRGVNLGFRMADDTWFEVQVHTRASLHHRDTTHLAYEVARVLDHDLARRHRIEAPVQQAAKEVPRPPGVEALLWWRRDRIAHQ
jgi:hypothetical protein